MIIGINESKTLTKHDHANVNLNLMVENIIPIKSGITKNIDVSVKNNICEKDYTWNSATCSCEKGKYYEWFSDYVRWNYRRGR